MYSIPCRASCFAYMTILKNRMNSSFSLNSFWCNSSYYSKSSKAKHLARQGTEKIRPPQTEVTTFAFSSVCILLLWWNLYCGCLESVVALDVVAVAHVTSSSVKSYVAAVVVMLLRPCFVLFGPWSQNIFLLVFLLYYSYTIIM